jgi:hypothetical protein
MAIHRKNRSRKIEFDPIRINNNNDVSMLGQWHYRQRGEDRFGPHETYGFRSIIKRRGMPGLWLDTPYYCYGGVHRYRRLPVGLAAKIYLYSLNGWSHITAKRVRRKVTEAAYRVYRFARYWSPSAIRERRELDRLWQGGEW